MMPMRGSMVSPPCSTTSISATMGFRPTPASDLLCLRWFNVNWTKVKDHLSNCFSNRGNRSVMLARLGHVLYWTGCLIAALSLSIGWISYPGVDTTGIKFARQSGASDEAILEQRMAAGTPTEVQQYKAASQAGYSPTEILDYLVMRKKSRLAALPDLQQNPELVVAGVVAILAWLIGRALRFVLAGT
jgi:hypothetical protein